MLKQLFDTETYRKMGSPDLDSTIFIKRGTKKVYGRVALIDFYAHKNKIEIGIEPFKK